MCLQICSWTNAACLYSETSSFVIIIYKNKYYLYLLDGLKTGTVYKADIKDEKFALIFHVNSFCNNPDKFCHFIFELAITYNENEKSRDWGKKIRSNSCERRDEKSQRAAPRNAANIFPDFSAGLSQNSVMVKKIQQLVEKHEKLTICVPPTSERAV
jgi:hypothetical protein